MKIDGEYKITDKISIGGQKEIKPPPQTKTTGQPPVATPPEDNRVYLKYKARF